MKFSSKIILGLIVGFFAFSVGLKEAKASAPIATLALECNVACHMNFQLGGIGYVRACGTCSSVWFVKLPTGPGCCDTGLDNSGPGPMN